MFIIKTISEAARLKIPVNIWWWVWCEILQWAGFDCEGNIQWLRIRRGWGLTGMWLPAFSDSVPPCYSSWQIQLRIAQAGFIDMRHTKAESCIKHESPKVMPKLYMDLWHLIWKQIAVHLTHLWYLHLVLKVVYRLFRSWWFLVGDCYNTALTHTHRSNIKSKTEAGFISSKIFILCNRLFIWNI